MNSYKFSIKIKTIFFILILATANNSLLAREKIKEDDIFVSTWNALVKPEENKFKNLQKTSYGLAAGEILTTAVLSFAESNIANAHTDEASREKLKKFTKKFQVTSKTLNEVINAAIEIQNPLAAEIAKAMLNIVKTYQKNNADDETLNKVAKKAISEAIELTLKRITFKITMNSSEERFTRKMVKAFTIALITAFSKTIVKPDYNTFTGKFVETLITTVIIEGIGELLMREIELAQKIQAQTEK